MTAMTPLKIGVSGCAGRMGREVIKAVLADEKTQLVGGIVSPQSQHRGSDLAAFADRLEPLGMVATDDPSLAFTSAEVMIDFSRPALTLQLAELAASQGKILITGTTGFTPEQQATLAAFAQRSVIVQSFNMSLGVNLLAALVEKVAATLDSDFDIEILEMHHRLKVDAPSGTALLLGDSAAKGRNQALADVACYAREGITGTRPVGEIGFATLRGGDVIGDHHVIFAGAGERVTLSHQSGSRKIYAQGAIKAALWAKNQPAGLYSMRNVLEL
jgi:4-hydroxy-tetrahydrodipicolinate reductase